VYAADNAATLNAIKRMGQRARGVAVIDKATSAGAIDEMAAAGVRGVRLNLQTDTAGKFDADGAKALLDTTAQQIAGRGWHVQFYTGLGNIAALKDHFMQLPFPVVFDHFGRASADKGPSQPGFDALLELVKSGHAYVKISGAYRVSKQTPDYADVTPLTQALVAANVDRLVWGVGLAAPRFRRRPRQATDPHRRAISNRRRVGVQSTSEVGAGRGHAQKDPGRQSGAALRLRQQGDLTAREECVDVGALW
jgi:predicted TIM-barrel fold metal-dependent hydrolase